MDNSVDHLIPIQWKQEISNNFADRLFYYDFPGSLPATVINGQNPFTGWGPDYYNWVNSYYNSALNVSSPASLTILGIAPNSESGIDVTIQVDITANISSSDNVLFVIPTITYTGDYSNVALALGYTEMPLTTADESQEFVVNVEINPEWDYSTLKFVTILQSGAMGREEAKPILQAAMTPSAFPFLNAEVSGSILDQYSSEPVVNAKIRLGGFETTTDDNGNYTLPVMQGNYNVYLEAEDYENYAGEFVVDSSSELLSLSMDRQKLAPNDLAGFVLDSDELKFKWVQPGKIKGVREGFDDGVLPAGWNNDSGYWFVGENGSTPEFTIPAFDGDYISISGNRIGMLKLPTFDLSRINELNLTFNVYYISQNGDSFNTKVQVSEDGGDSWETLYTVGSSTAWHNVEVDLSDFCGSGHDNVQVGFLGDSMGGYNSGCALDDIICGRGFRDWDILGYNLYQAGNSTPLNGEDLISSRNYTIPLPDLNTSYYATAVYDTGESAQSNSWVFDSLAGDNLEVPAHNISMKVYPNPFNPNTTISFSLNTEITENTEIEIYNLKGQKVKSFVCHPELDEGRSTNVHSVTWNGTDNNNIPVSSGIYFARLSNGKQQASTKMVLMK